MTLQELAIKINRSENTIQHQFPRLQRQMIKIGIIITKTGYGKTADYQIIYKED